MHDLTRKCAQYDLSCRRAIKHHSFIHTFNLLPRDKILDWSKLKALAGNKVDSKPS